MDSLTQAALGAVVGQVMLGRLLGRRALAWGALFGTLPDLDVVANLFLGQAGELRVHRGLTHGLPMMLLMSWLLAKPLARRWKKEKVTPWRAGGWVFAEWSTHVLIDGFTVYGTQIFDPFHSYRWSLDNLSIVDPLFTLPLLAAVATALWVKPKEWKKGSGVRAGWVGLAVCVLYVGLSFWAKATVARGFERDLARRGVAVFRRMEAPTMGNLFWWRSLAERDGEIWIGYRSIWDRDEKPVEWVVVPKGEADLAAFQGEKEVATVQWFSKGWWVARRAGERLWIADLRFSEGRVWDERGVALRPKFAWEFDVEAKGDRLSLRPIEVTSGKEYFRRVIRRVSGEENAWDAPPRMVGMPSALQEHLKRVR